EPAVRGDGGRSPRGVPGRPRAARRRPPRAQRRPALRGPVPRGGGRRAGRPTRPRPDRAGRRGLPPAPPRAVYVLDAGPPGRVPDLPRQGDGAASAAPAARGTTGGRRPSAGLQGPPRLLLRQGAA